tara:strand:+ start:241 stop:483 length:243 start_codon:yes stop_codon:yes gene_type:complete
MNEQEALVLYSEARENADFHNYQDLKHAAAKLLRQIDRLVIERPVDKELHASLYSQAKVAILSGLESEIIAMRAIVGEQS